MKRARIPLLAVVCFALLWAVPAGAKQATRCDLTYEIDGWSFLYRTASGIGQIKCADGQSANVKISAHGAGFSLGTQSVAKGKGRFSGTFNVADLYGTYVEIGGHAGAGGSVDARAMFKGSKRLSLAGNGEGWNVGFALGGFSIQPR
jgi:hypothetical protein